MAKKKLYRSNKDVLVAGVLSGVAEYFDHDVTFWRLAFVVFLLLTGVMPGLLFYVIAWIVIPVEPMATFKDATKHPEESSESA
jgi:phage shock protein C